MIQLHHEMHKTQICRCRYFSDHNQHQIYLLCNSYLQHHLPHKKTITSSLFMGTTKKQQKKQLSLMVHTLHLSSGTENNKRKSMYFCWIFILFNYKTQSHMMWRGLECNVLKTKPSIKSLIKLMSSGTPVLLLIFPHTWTGRGEMGRKRERKHERRWKFMEKA